MTQTGEQHARTTAREHEAIVKALHTLERTLAAPFPSREQQWKRRTAAALTVVVDELRQHVESAEAERGLIPSCELIVGRPHELNRAQTDHPRLVDEATALLRELTESASQCEDVRERAAQLATAIRRHQAVEADLILLAYDQDIGVVD